MSSLIFYGTSAFAVPSLRALAHDARFLIVAVVTQPDRPVGRHATLTATPVKLAALELGLPLLQFEQVKSDEAFAILNSLKADAAVVASFGQIIPQRVLDLTPRGAVNVHASLLPKYRGASPIAAAIKNGDAETGITLMKMDALLDHGPIISLTRAAIRPDDTAATLTSRLADLGAKILPDALYEYCEGRIKPIEQDHANATKVPLLKREDGSLDWNKSATELERTIRAYDPWPGTFTLFDAKRLKILQAIIGQTSDSPIGTRLIEDNLPSIVCGDRRTLRLLKVQPEGKATMDGKTFLNGRRDWLSV